MAQPLHVDIERTTKRNIEYRNIIYTDDTMQVIIQSLEPGEEVPFESHEISQFIRCESGSGIVTIQDTDYILEEGIAITIPYNTRHRIKNTSNRNLKFYTVYSGKVH
jgi:mannose-6-phosphate isomerase-like protein (cupin superfamily)